MLKRRVGAHLAYLLDHVPAVALLGPRQAGKTTLALSLSQDRPAVYLDMTLLARRIFVVYPGTDRYWLDDATEAIGVLALARELQTIR